MTKLTAAQLDELSSSIKQLGRGLGFTKLGIADTSRTEDEAPCSSAGLQPGGTAKWGIWRATARSAAARGSSYRAPYV